MGRAKMIAFGRPGWPIAMTLSIYRRNQLVTFDHQRGVVATETKRIAQDSVHLGGAAGLGHEVERAFRVRIVEIDGGRNESFLDRFHRGDEFDGSRRAAHVSGHGLCGGNRNLLVAER